MIKAKIKLALNKRGAPSVNASKGNHYVVGQEVNIVDLINGDLVEGIDVWYKLDNGSYVWSGGVEGISTLIQGELRAQTSEIDDGFINYNELFSSLPSSCRQNLGEGIAIAIIDSGINEKHPDFEDCFDNSVFQSIDCTGHSDSLDQYGHGTHVGGLIGARSLDEIGIIGVAPKCSLWNVKCLNENGGVVSSSLDIALDEIINKKPHIVNMSFSMTKQDFLRLEPKLKEIDSMGIIMVASAGENDILTKFSLYPAYSEYVISIGSVTSDFELNGRKFHSSLDFIVPQIKLKSLSIKRFRFYKYEEGSSMAAALITGLSSLLVKNNQSLNRESLLTELSKFSTKFSEADFSKPNLIRP